jgi:hypothetical protein
MQFARLLVEGVVANELEGVVAARRGLGIDARKVDPVAAAAREVVDDVTVRTRRRVLDRVEVEAVGVTAAVKPVAAEPASDRVFPRVAFENIAGSAAEQLVVAGRAGDRDRGFPVPAVEGVVAEAKKYLTRDSAAVDDDTLPALPLQAMIPAMVPALSNEIRPSMVAIAASSPSMVPLAALSMVVVNPGLVCTVIPA